MKRHIPGLQQGAQEADDLPEGLYLVEVKRGQYCPHPRKPFFTVRFSVLEPQALADRAFAGRLHCTPKALWKLSWFLRDFGYDAELLGRDEVDERALVGLRGIAKVSHTTINGHAFLNLDGFAPAHVWEELSSSTTEEERKPEEIHDV